MNQQCFLGYSCVVAPTTLFHAEDHSSAGIGRQFWLVLLLAPGLVFVREIYIWTSHVAFPRLLVKNVQGSAYPVMYQMDRPFWSTKRGGHFRF